MNPHFSIDLIICTYNNAPLLERALMAISQQQVPPEIEWKVLVVNNNCTDETVPLVEKLIQSGKIPNLSIILEPIQGLTPARLCGVENTTSDWFAFVDDDCILEKDWVAQAAKFALSHPECGAFGGQVILDWETPPPAFVLNYGYSFAQQEHGTNMKQMSCLVGAGLVINRAVLEKTGWVEQQFLADRVGKKLISGGDVEIALRIASKAPLWYVPELKLKHIIPPRRTSETYLMKINYGLGSSQLFGDSMLWSGSYLTWLLVCIWNTLKATLGLFIPAFKVIIRRKAAIDVAIPFYFLRGKWAGIWKMFWMNPQHRQALLGCAEIK